MIQAQNTLYLTFEGQTITATLEDNPSVEELKSFLPLTILFSDYGGWEKVGELPSSITRDDRQMTARPGDIMLYQGRSLVIFYGENSWAYTPIAKIDNISDPELKALLASKNIEMHLSLTPPSLTEVEDVSRDNIIPQSIYNLNGQKIKAVYDVKNLPEGIYVIDNKKTLIK
ncbi:MAG: hypothetical protein K2J15_05710 [Muribaculaceae bacterium]|nr:hypothetical protein [Muribaculaceae bacterium]